MARNNSSNFWRFFREFVFPHKLALFLLVGNILIRAGLENWWPLSIGWMTDEVVLPALKGPFSWQLFATIAGVGFGVYLVNSLLIWVFNPLLNNLLTVVTQRVRTRLAAHLLKLHAQFYDSHQAGRLLTTAIEDPQSITQQLTAEMIRTAASFFAILGSYGILLHYSVTLTLAISCVFPVMALSFFLLRPKIVDASENVREHWGQMIGLVAEKLAAVRVVRSFAAEETEAAYFRKRVSHHADLNLKANYYGVLYGVCNGMAIYLGYALVFLVGGWLSFHGHITLGVVVAFYSYFQSLYPKVQQLFNLPQLITQASGSLSKIYGLLDEPLIIRSQTEAPDFQEVLKEIEFKDVSFRYRAELPWVLRHFSLKVFAGTTIGIIGPSGSGKTTLMQLLLRFHDPVEGQILVNGKDVRHWDLQSLRRAFGLVPQETILFSGPIRDNLLYSRQADDGRIWDALEQAEAADFVKKLPERLEAKLGEKGVSLSGGQKQRLSIARALLTQPQVLVLDNCTSALDSETEKRLQATLRKVQAGKTAFEISHRISSVAHCSRILVMDKGTLVEQGTFDELVAGGGYFAAIHQQQSGNG
jgi:ABC-type multidrug transport system fused ATPase/permease subunit